MSKIRKEQPVFYLDLWVDQLCLRYAVPIPVSRIEHVSGENPITWIKKEYKNEGIFLFGTISINCCDPNIVCHQDHVLGHIHTAVRESGTIRPTRIGRHWLRRLLNALKC